MEAGRVPDADPPVDRPERDAESAEADSTSPPPPGHHLFDAVVVGSPVEELEEVYEKAVRGVRADPEAADRVTRAYRIARQNLLAQLGAETETPAGPMPAPDDSPDEGSPC